MALPHSRRTSGPGYSEILESEIAWDKEVFYVHYTLSKEKRINQDSISQTQEKATLWFYYDSFKTCPPSEDVQAELARIPE